MDIASDSGGAATELDGFRAPVQAMAELRRGAAVIVRRGSSVLAVAAAEAVSGGLADLGAWATPPLLAVWPAQPLGHDAPSGMLVGRTLVTGDLTQAQARELAAPRLLRPSAEPGLVIPEAAADAIRLAKLAHLLPTLLVGDVEPTALTRAVAAGAVIVHGCDIRALAGSGHQVARVGEANVPLAAGAARLVAYRHLPTGAEHLAIVIGAPDASLVPAPLVRLHSECFTGDVLGSLRCDCGPQLRLSISRMAAEGAGVVLYLAQEGRGIGLLNKLRAYMLQDQGLDTLDANLALGWGEDERDFAVAATILHDLGVPRIRLLTNNPAKVAALAAGGIAVERTGLVVAPNGVDDAYLETKATRFGHLL